MSRTLRIRRVLVLIFAGWTLVVAASLWWSVKREQNQAERLAVSAARSLFEKDIIYRQWAAGHGGVYVPVTDETPPNPYLDEVSERDVVTPSGRRLTLVNPAYMTRQVHELGRRRYGVVAHITSLKPVNPNNGPDEWERQALQSFEDGVQEAAGVQPINGEPYMRLMRPLITDKACLVCHAKHGYEEGDVRGGISVAVSMLPYTSSALNEIELTVLSHVILWLLGAGGIALGGTDINRRAREIALAEEATKRSEEEWATTFDAMSDWVSLIDVETGRILRSNRSGEGLLGLSARQTVGRPCWEVVHGTTGPLPACPLVKMRETRKLETLELYLEEQERWIMISVDPVLDVRGEIVSAVHVVRDITAHKKAEDEIRELNAGLEDRVRERTSELSTVISELEAFTYSVSHDLRGPLRVIDGFSRIVIDEHADNLDTEAKQYLELVVANVERMGQLVNDLLALSRLGRLALKRHSIEPREIVQEVLEDLHAAREGRDVEIIVGDLPKCSADPLLLRQVYLNLLSNAFKFTRKRESARIEIGSVEEDGVPTYFVMDNGVGFEMLQADKIFGLFQRLHDVGEYEGTGVGLAIVQRVVDRHGGRVWVEAEPDEGATFYFTLAGDSSG